MYNKKDCVDLNKWYNQNNWMKFGFETCKSATHIFQVMSDLAAQKDMLCI